MCPSMSIMHSGEHVKCAGPFNFFIFLARSIRPRPAVLHKFCPYKSIISLDKNNIAKKCSPPHLTFFFSEKEEKKLFSLPPKQHIWRLGEKERSTTPLTVMSD